MTNETSLIERIRAELMSFRLEHVSREEVIVMLQAMREPTSTMLTAAKGGRGKPTDAVATDLWIRMIEAAQAE